MGSTDDHPRGETYDSCSGNSCAAGGWRRSSDVNCLRIVRRNVNHLWIGRLNNNYLLAFGGGLHYDLLLRRCLQVAGCLRLRAQPLNRIEDAIHVGNECLAKRLRPIRFLDHHLDDLGKRRQRYQSGIEAGFQCSVLEVAPLQTGIFHHPAGKLVEPIHIRGSLQNLKDEGIRVKGDRTRQLIDRIRRSRRSRRLLRKWSSRRNERTEKNKQKH